MSNIFVEENGIYSIDCTNAVWATDKMHADYQKAGLHIKDVDFLIETDWNLFIRMSGMFPVFGITYRLFLSKSMPSFCCVFAMVRAAIRTRFANG